MFLTDVVSSPVTDRYVPAIEMAPVDEIRRFQERRMKLLLEYLQGNSIFYQHWFARHQVDINHIRTLDDLQSVPPVTKEELQRHNDDFLCVGRSKVIDYITTSGTLGDPVTFAMTDRDLDRLAYNEAISFCCAGCHSGDVFQLTTTIDKRFMAGLAYFMGARKMGAGSVRVGAGIPELQWDSIQRFSPSVLVAVPSFLLKLIQYAETNGIDYRQSSVRKAICIGEALRNADFSLSTLGQRIMEKWPIELYSTYASTEMGTAFTECEAMRGGHHHPELIIVEFLDDNNQPVAEGMPGEVAVTTLGVEGMPLLRFKTGDICHHYTEPCSCGRTTMRLGPVIGRRQQMIKFKGTTLYPPSLYDILNNIEGVINFIVEVYTNDIGTDEILIRIGSRETGESFEKEIKDHFRAKLRVSPAVLFQPVEEIQRLQNPETSRKPVTFIDRR